MSKAENLLREPGNRCKPARDEARRWSWRHCFRVAAAELGKGAAFRLRYRRCRRKTAHEAVAAVDCLGGSQLEFGWYHVS